MVSAISAKAFAATADCFTDSASIPDTASAYSFKDVPNASNSVPNLISELSPVRKDAMPSNILAAVSVNIMSANVFTPANIDGLICFAPSMNGPSSFMKADRFAPTSGNDAVTPSRIPPTIPPINPPIALPMLSSNSPPSSMSHFNPGI